jgi:hypothetical protein
VPKIPRLPASSKRCGVGISAGKDVERIKQILVALSQGKTTRHGSSQPWRESKKFTREAQAAGLLQLILSGVDAGNHQ